MLERLPLALVCMYANSFALLSYVLMPARVAMDALRSRCPSRLPSMLSSACGFGYERKHLLLDCASVLKVLIKKHVSRETNRLERCEGVELHTVLDVLRLLSTTSKRTVIRRRSQNCTIATMERIESMQGRRDLGVGLMRDGEDGRCWAVSMRGIEQRRSRYCYRGSRGTQRRRLVARVGACARVQAPFQGDTRPETTPVRVNGLYSQLLASS